MFYVLLKSFLCSDILWSIFVVRCAICYYLYNLKKHEKHPWRSVNFSCRLQPATLLKLTLLCGCSSRFLNCTNSTKSSNASHLYTTFIFNIPQKSRYLYFLFYKTAVYIIFTFCKHFKNCETKVSVIFWT